jgi:hypothetical protein
MLVGVALLASSPIIDAVADPDAAPEPATSP